MTITTPAMAKKSLLRFREVNPFERTLRQQPIHSVERSLTQTFFTGI